MSEDVKQGWQALGEKMTALGSLMQQRISAPASGEPGPDGERTTDQVKAALDQVVAATRELGERLGDVARDDEVRATAKETMSSLDDALRATVGFVTDRVEGAFTTSTDEHDDG